MRTLRLARVAAEAEGLLLRRRLRRIGFQIGFGAVAALFAVFCLVMLHLFAWVRLRDVWRPEYAALALAGLDILIAAILALLAARSPEDRIQNEAIVVRDQALNQIRSAFTLSAMLRPLAGLLVEQWLARRGRKRD